MIAALFCLLLPIANPRVYATDEVQYYVYLRSLRFDGDLDFANDYRHMAELNPRSGIEGSLLQPNRIRAKTGLYGNVAPIGCAIMWAPFFLLADAAVQIANRAGAGIAADGYSWPYTSAVCYASALYGLLGLLICRELARRYTSERAASWATIAVWLSSPLVFYMFVQMPFAHSTGFFLVALFIWVWQRTRPAVGSGERRSLRDWALLGLIAGLMTMTREQLGLFLIIPLVEAVVHYAEAIGRRAALRAVWLAIGHATLLVVFALALVPQIVTYQLLNGEPRPASEVSGKLNWCSPHFIDTLVDDDPAPSAWCNTVGDFTAGFPPFSRGAFVWAPLLLPALLGLALLWRRDRLLLAALLAAFLAQTYINGAYGTTWHLRGAFGFRRLIECTPLFVIGLALLLDWLALRIGWRAVALLPLPFLAWNAGLVLNATLFNDVTGLRQYIRWPELWRWQLEVPAKLVGTVGDLLFDRCRLLQNCRR